MSLTDYIPHGAIVALAAVVSWVSKDHFKRDDTRFKYMADAVRDLGMKIDTVAKDVADTQAAAAHDVADKLDRANERQAGAVRDISIKLDKAISTQADNHTDILKLLIAKL
jgi:hypothetical protein